MCIFVFTNIGSYQQFLVLSRNQCIRRGVLTALRSKTTSGDKHPDPHSIKLTNQII